MVGNTRRTSHLCLDEVLLTSHHHVPSSRFGRTDSKLKDITAIHSNRGLEFPNLSFQMYYRDDQLSRPILNHWY